MLRLFALPTLAMLSATPVLADAAKPTFDDEIAPVLRQHCAGCHNNDRQRGGLNLASYGATQEGGSSGAVVVAGDSAKSRLYTLSNHSEEPVMPPSKIKLPDAQLELLKKWIDQGAREKSTSTASAPLKPKVDLGLKAVSRGKPEGPPPMPLAGKLPRDPLSRTRRAGSVLALAASPWAPLVAVGGQKQVLMHHADTGDFLGALPFDGQVNCLKFSRNGKFVLASGGRGGASGKAVLYSVETGAKVAEVGAQETDAILSADISADQTLIAVGTTAKFVRVYSVADGSVVAQSKKHTDWVTSVEFSPDGVLLATGDRAGGIFVWEAANLREFHSLRGHTQSVSDVSWRADSNLLASSSLDGSVRLWEMENGTQVKTWAAHGGGTESVKFGSDGKLATTGRDKLAKLFDANGAALKQFGGLADIGLRVAVTHDNSRVLGGDWGGNLRLWGAADGKLVTHFDTNPKPAAEELTAATAVLAGAEQELARVEGEHKRAEAGFAELAAAEAKHAQAVNAGKAELMGLQAKLPGLLEPAQKLPGEVAKLKAEATAKQGELDAARAKRHATAEAAQALGGAADKLEAAAKAAPGNAPLSQYAKDARAQAAKVQAEAKPAADAVPALEAALAATQKAEQTATAALATAQAAHAAAAKRFGELPGLIQASERALAELKPGKDSRQKSLGELAGALARAREAAEGARAKVARLKARA